jgi:regulator of sirC expression with transglutaminase-like and TPR domain
MGEISDSEFEALISLLDDPDEEILFHVSRRLREMGIRGVEKLEMAWEHAADELTQHRIEDLIKDIQLYRLKDELQLWIEKDSDDLLLGAVLIAKFRYPELDESVIYSTIERLAQTIWLELNNGLTALEEIHVFNNVFYKLSGFIGEQENFTDPELGYINKVLELKKGNSHALGILYLILCQKLNIPVYGIDLPYYFILAYIRDDDPDFDLSAVTRNEISFYINPVSEGTVFQSKQIREYMRKMEMPVKRSHFLPVDNKGVIRSLVHYLFMCYEQREEQMNAAHMRELLALFDEFTEN